eukprot:CAMPEP_0198506178 /NCGR_PEP_ID=MMETSP1462-20131121/11531_1 /TAXON_ID=1333877 /ORGANISM="Brandtodinium nutriculum, Strain RCC3387" /LENGTH=136 /DNA_ID=CAMNT_0044235393 /DNA_START=60 /DNA_END=471 /DNA_ORIENTATION=+
MWHDLREVRPEVEERLQRNAPARQLFDLGLPRVGVADAAIGHRFLPLRALSIREPHNGPWHPVPSPDNDTKLTTATHHDTVLAILMGKAPGVGDTKCTNMVTTNRRCNAAWHTRMDTTRRQIALNACSASTSDNSL